MSQSITGIVHKLKAFATETLQYSLPIGEVELPLNEFLGQTLTLTFLGKISCSYCGQVTKKSYSQGYCFPCSQKLARCDFCIVRPEKCHFHLGTCREPEWGKTHCFIPHIVYLANTSGLKVGITRGTQIPTRWIDQGAIQALPIFRVQNRYQSGLLEIILKKKMADKTDWRKMLKGDPEILDLTTNREAVFIECKKEFEKSDLKLEAEFLETEETIHFQYPVIQYPTKVTSLNFEKQSTFTGTLLGIKGQYLIFDQGVTNIRNLTGFLMNVKVH